MLREHSNRNDTLRVIKRPLFLCPIIKPRNHRWDQDHILQGTAHTSRMRQAFLSSQTRGEGGRRGRMRKRDFSPLPTLVIAAGAEPTSASSLTALQSGQYYLWAPAAAQMDFLGSCYNMRPFWAAFFSDLEPRGVRRGLLTHMSGYCTWCVVLHWTNQYGAAPATWYRDS